MAHRQRDEEKRNHHYREAIRWLNRTNNTLDVITSPSKKEDYIASFLTTAHAALDCRMWDEALAILDKLIEIIPETPMAHYLRAQVIVARGEAQLLYQDLEVTNRDVGSEALSEATGLKFSQSLAEAQRLLGVLVTNGRY